MRSDIGTLKLSDEEKKFIEDYFKYIRLKMNYPTHPEISIGSARYPLGRFVLRQGLTKKFIEVRKNYLSKQGKTRYTEMLSKFVENLEEVYKKVEQIRTKGKTVNSYKR